MGRLAGRVAVVTGASRGIGRSIAHRFAAEGAKVVVASRKQEGVEVVAQEIRAAGGFALPRALHVGQLDAIGPWWEAVQSEVGHVDILVNNAGTNPYFGPVLGTEWAAWDKTFEVNLKGPFEMARQLARRHVDSRLGQPASIISVASILGTGAAPLQGVYGMTKAALMSMTRTMAVELGETGIRVNAIAPGIVDTKLASALTSDKGMREHMTNHTALKRIAQPDEIAGLAVYLASEESSYVTGQTWLIDGGFTIV
jgi:NAD(P)-dependent dehydrogenase (short-subunit alcohol dehydrogenase family)